MTGGRRVYGAAERDMHAVARAEGEHVAARQRVAWKQRQVAEQVKQLVPRRLIREAQPGGVEPPRVRIADERVVLTIAKSL